MIDLFYGTSQSFGGFGSPQTWVNILGNVSDPSGVDNLSYRLNGGPSKPLSIGPDTRRLEYSGDFNIDLHINDLNNGINTVVITATDNLSNVSQETVTVNYNAATSWPLPYSIDWSLVSDIQDVAQVVDGAWTLQNGALRINSSNYGYDREVAIGDLAWDDYEITVPVTIHGIDPSGFDPPSNSPAIGIVMRWKGHTDNPVAGWQPKSGWFPLGVIGWYRWQDMTTGELQLYGNGGSILDIDSTQLQTGVTYIYKLRVETIPGQGGLYSFKVW
ncbi:MAG: hypothetical protein R3335_04570, partial [Anaerolineales bacterium]|nr:hypothetical protein [Anaerolineales bacterium]